MFPIPSGRKLSFIEIGKYWSRDKSSFASSEELRIRRRLRRLGPFSATNSPRHHALLSVGGLRRRTRPLGLRTIRASATCPWTDVLSPDEGQARWRAASRSCRRGQALWRCEPAIAGKRGRRGSGATSKRANCLLRIMAGSWEFVGMKSQQKIPEGLDAPSTSTMLRWGGYEHNGSWRARKHDPLGCNAVCLGVSFGMCTGQCGAEAHALQTLGPK